MDYRPSWYEDKLRDEQGDMPYENDNRGMQMLAIALASSSVVALLALAAAAYTAFNF